MPRQRVVGWVECVARTHPAAIQRHRSRDSGKMEGFLTAGRNPCLPAGIWISVLYLEQQDAQNLALRGMRNAPPHRRRDGMYLFSLVMIVLNVAAFGPGFFRRKGQPIMPQPEAAMS